MGDIKNIVNIKIVTSKKYECLVCTGGRGLCVRVKSELSHKWALKEGIRAGVEGEQAKSLRTKYIYKRIILFGITTLREDKKRVRTARKMEEERGTTGPRVRARTREI